jgi:hypothetical protein
MKHVGITVLFLTLLPIRMMAQSEVNDRWQSVGNASAPVDAPKTDFSSYILRDTLRLYPETLHPQLPQQVTPQLTNFNKLARQGATGFNLWKGASLGFYGMTNQLPGLMNTETGMMTLYQNAGRWHFTASAVANKYWMPWQHTLSTQYGFGGTLGYDLNESISLHAFGYYYANQLQVGPAMSPFVNSTTYGGYADIRFNNTFGTKMGVRRYVSPWTGKWITEPIINPYIKIGDTKIELPIGGILKALVWGDRDDPMHFQPRPHPIAQPGQRIRR